MPLPLLIPAIGSLASFFGGLFGNDSKQQQQTTPTLDPAYGPLQRMLLEHIQGRLTNPTGLPANYETGGIANINKSYELTNQNTANRLTAAGLSRSPIAGNAIAQSNRARAGDIGNFRANLPLVSQQLQDQDLNLASSLLNFGRGQTSTASGSSGGGVGGGFDSLATMLGYLYGSGKFNKGGGGNGLPGQLQAGTYF